MSKSEAILSYLTRLIKYVVWFVYDLDYCAALISFVLMCYNLATDNPHFIANMFIFECFVALYLLRRVSDLFNKIKSIEKSLDGAKIKRIELEVTPKE